MKKIIFAWCLFIMLIGCGQETMQENNKVANTMTIIGHRGAMGYAPEHTMESFKLAKNMGVDYLEFDVQMSKDGELVAIHDTEVSRTTNGTGDVKDLTIKEIKKLDAGSWFNEENPSHYNEQYIGAKVPTVREIFEEFGNSVNYYIETKSPHLYPGIEEKLINMLKEFNLLEKKGQVILHSASKDSLVKMNELAPNTELGILLWYTEKADISESELDELKGYVTYIIPNHDFLTPDYIKKVKDAGFSIQAYTVNESEDYKRLMDWGLDGVITNYPDIN